jgi:2-methylisocitrate lyase-like PEP mutase family enzyme
MRDETCRGVCQVLRQALRGGEPAVAPLCYDPLTGKLVEYLGFLPRRTWAAAPWASC